MQKYNFSAEKTMMESLLKSSENYQDKYFTVF